MKFQVILTVLATVAATVSGAPARTKQTPREKRAEQRYSPQEMVQIHETDPTTPYGLTNFGKVSRINGGNNVQTLMNIPIPSSASGKQCSLVFTDPTAFSGSKQMQLFTLGDNKVIGAQTTFENRPYRDQHIADVYVAADSATFTTYGEAFKNNDFPCPAGKTLSFELVSVGDNDDITWELPNGLAVVSSD